MKISFYKNFEFIDTYPNNISKSQPKGTFYVEILNNLDNIINWIEDCINITNSNQTDSLKFPRPRLYRNNKVVIMVINIIKKNISDSFFQTKKHLDDLKKHYIKSINNEKFEKYIEHATSIINDKRNIIAILEKNLYFLKMHRNKVNYFIVKNLKLKNDILDNQIKSIFSGIIELPAYSKILYYEDNGALKRSDNIYSEYSNLTEEVRRSKIIKAFKNQEFNYINKYEICNVLELMNIYFNEFIDNKILLKKCKNCDKYFIPNNKQIYCDNPSPQNTNKTCRLLSNDIKANSDKIYEVYRKTYKTQHNKLKRHLDTGNINKENLKERFNKWNKIAKDKKDTCKTVDDYIKWYQSSLNWIEDFK